MTACVSGWAEAVQADRHTRLVALLKVVFPLLALAILSTLFLLSRAMSPEAVIPFAEKEIQDRLRDQQVTGPFFSGTTVDGDQISFSAEKLTTPPGEVGSTRAEDVRVQVDLVGGASVSLDARIAHFDMAEDRAELEGDVVIRTSGDYIIHSERLTTQMAELDVRSPGPVRGRGPVGTLDAGSMELMAAGESNAAQLIFKNGVKLIYDPQSTEK